MFLIFTSALGLGLVFFWYVYGGYICRSEGVFSALCNQTTAATLAHSLYFFVLLVPAILIAPLASSVFNHWRIFALPAIPIVTILTIYIMQMSDGGGVGVVGIHPGLLYLALIYILYFLASFVIIGWAWWKTRKR